MVGKAIKWFRIQLVALGTEVPFIGSAMGVVTNLATTMGGALKKVAKFFLPLLTFLANFLGPLTGIGAILSGFGVFFGIFFVLSQAWSKAMGMMKIDGFLQMISASPKFVIIMDKLRKIVAKLLEPFNFLVDIFADLIVAVMGGKEAKGLELLLNGIIWFLDIIDSGASKLANKVVLWESYIYVFIQAIFSAVHELGGFIAQLKTDGIISALGSVPDRIKRIGSGALDAGYEHMKKRGFGDKEDGSEDPETLKAKVEQNINTVKIMQDFKDKQDPDRIAFKINDVLKSVANNKTAGRGDALTNDTRGA